MEATEGQCGAGCVLQMKLQRTQSRVSELRSSEMHSRNRWSRREYSRVAELSRRIQRRAKDTPRTQADRDSCNLLGCGVYRLSLSTLKIRFHRAR